MSSGQINGAGSPQNSQQLPNTEALDTAKNTEIVRLKNGRFKVGTSKGSLFNRTIRKAFSEKSYLKHATEATEKQREAAFDKMQEITGNQFESRSLKNRRIDVSDVRNLLNPPSTNAPEFPGGPETHDIHEPRNAHTPPNVPEIVGDAISSGESGKVYKALQAASKNLHEGKELKSKDLAGGARFGDIASPRDTAINVKMPKQDGSYESKPMHANRVGGRFIATQAPLVHNTRLENDNHQSTSVFFKMLHQENTNTVVNLTNAKDAMDGKSNCLYWPEEVGTTEEHGGLLVKTTGIEKKDSFDVITIKIGPPGSYSNVLNGKKSKEVKVFHFHAWPDHGVPEGKDVEKFNKFQAEVEARGEPHNTTVHCRAGVGRTGVFIALDQLKQDARNGLVNHSNLLTKAAETVWEGRQERGQHFVQRDSQFEFIISEMEKELDRLDEQRADSNDEGYVSETNSVDKIQTAANALSADFIIDKLKNNSYNSQDDIYPDIKQLDEGNLNKLFDQLEDWADRSNDEEHEMFFHDLARYTRKQIDYVDLS